MPAKESIRKLFDDIAVGYDRFNHLSTLGIDNAWRRKAVRQIVDTDQPLNVLDVATGTADFAIAIARKAAEGSHIIGTDISEGMLEVGRKKAQDLLSTDSSSFSLQVADAEALPFDDASFDRVSVAFGVRNFENLALGLSEMRRVLKPSGKLVILELSYPDNKLLFAAYKVYAFRILPLIGKWLTGNKGAYQYLPASILRFPKPDVFVPMLKAAGFTTVKHKSLTFGVCRMYTAIC